MGFFFIIEGTKEINMKKIFILLALLILVPTAYARAKGDFDYVTIKGPGITGEINVTNPALTRDFLAFADFSKGEIPAPADPGQGYQVVRVYVEFTDSKPKDLPFDQLHYSLYRLRLLRRIGRRLIRIRRQVVCRQSKCRQTFPRRACPACSTGLDPLWGPGRGSCWVRSRI
jgi:hypothetical protein